MNDLRTFLDHAKIDAVLIDLGVPMTTAEAAANQLNVPVGCIFKSLVLCDPEGRIFVVVVPGDKRIDMKAAAKQVGSKKLRFAKPNVVLQETGYPAGGTPPLGHRKPLAVIVDEDILLYEVGYGGGGRAELLLKIRPDILVKAANAHVAKVTLSS